MSAGFRVYLKRKLPSKEIVEGFKNLHAASVADCMGRLPAMSWQINLLSNPSKEIMCGVALTVKARSGDNLALHKALNMAGEGDVIVVSNEGERNRSLMGENMISFAKFNRVEGIVVDGPIRDMDAVAKLDWHIFATGATPNGPFKEGPGEVNVPIACGGVMVNPGDIILGDADGVIVIPKEAAPEVLKKASEFAEIDSGKTVLARKGELNRSWVDKALDSKECEIIDDVYKG
ncbi:MAG: RraA family protein [Clostridia bacterium]